jgi:hypothetical protein
VVGLVGCETPRHRVTGQVAQKGLELDPQKGPYHLVVIFAPEDRQRHPDAYGAQTDAETLSYTIPAIPSGKYVVAVQLFDAHMRDVFGHRYELSKTTFRCEVTGSMEFPIEVPR